MNTIRLEELREGGVKSLNIAKLMQKGFPVPRGFVLTKQAFESFIQSNNSPAKEQIPGSKIPDSVLFDLKQKYDSLSFDIDMKGMNEQAVDLISAGRGQARVSVRGEGSVILNVRGFSQLQVAVKQMWSNGSKELIIQKMLESDKSGIISDTVTSNETIIESAWGLMIPDDVTPDLFIVNDELKTMIGSKELLIKKDFYSDKTITEKVPEEMQQKPSLSTEDVRNLIKLKKDISETFQNNVRIEFAIQRGKPWIFQASPVDSKEFSQPQQQEANPITQGIVITPGSLKGSLRVVNSPEDINLIEVGDIVVTRSLDNQILKTSASGLILESGCIQKLSKKIKIPAIRVQNISVITGSTVYLDAVNGLVYPEEKESVPFLEHKESNAPIMLSLSSVNENVINSRGVFIKSENIIADGQANSFNGYLKHPSLIARESPNQTINTLETSLESLGRKIFPKPLWYRCFDGRADEMQGMEGSEKETNPILGWRGIKRSLEDPVFQRELESVKRLYDKGLNNIFLMFPFVSDVEDLKKAKQMITFPVKIGITIETPSAAMAIESFCKEGIFAVQVDLDSLTQLTLGIDIDNHKFSHHFSIMNPGVEKLVKWVLETCKKFNIESSVKGEACNSQVIAEKLLEWGANTITTDTDNVETTKNMF